MATAHPDWQLSVLVRSKEKAAQVSSKYPGIRIVHGDLDSADIIEEEVKNADIVFSQYHQKQSTSSASIGLTSLGQILPIVTTSQLLKPSLKALSNTPQNIHCG
jgi:putative NADH-flavin reductase